jgi:hypothetical protein
MDAKLGLDLLSRSGRLIDPTNGKRRPGLGNCGTGRRRYWQMTATPVPVPRPWHC